ncbi:MAG: hypothetical protein ACUVTY_00355 [Armatimonadota bacterium]
MLRRLKPRFGLGMFTAVVIALLLWWSGALKQPEPHTDLRVVYEANRAGKLRRVEAPTVPPSVPPTIKEPRLLLEHADALQLTPQQRTRIQRIVVEWEQEQKQWLERLHAEQERAEVQIQLRRGRPVPYTTLRQSLEGYANLSQAYASARRASWERALAQLSAQQRVDIEKVMSTQ